MTPPPHDQNLPPAEVERVRDGLAHHCDRADEADAGHAMALANLRSERGHSLNLQHDYQHALTDVYAMQRVRRLLDRWTNNTLEPGQVRRVLDELRTAIGTREPCRGRGTCRWMAPSTEADFLATVCPEDNGNSPFGWDDPANPDAL